MTTTLYGWTPLSAGKVTRHLRSRRGRGRPRAADRHSGPCKVRTGGTPHGDGSHQCLRLSRPAHADPGKGAVSTSSPFGGWASASSWKTTSGRRLRPQPEPRAPWRAPAHALRCLPRWTGAPVVCRSLHDSHRVRGAHLTAPAWPVPPVRFRVRHRSAGGPDRGLAPRGADLRRPRRRGLGRSTTRTSPSSRPSERIGERLATASVTCRSPCTGLPALPPSAASSSRTPSSSSASTTAGALVLDEILAGLLAFLARRPVGGGPGRAQLRQAVRARLAGLEQSAGTARQAPTRPRPRIRGRRDRRALRRAYRRTHRVRTPSVKIDLPPGKMRQDPHQQHRRNAVGRIIVEVMPEAGDPGSPG